MKLLVEEQESLLAERIYRGQRLYPQSILDHLIENGGDGNNRLKLALREWEVLDYHEIVTITKVGILTSDSSIELQISFIESLLIWAENSVPQDLGKFFFAILTGTLEAANVLLRDLTPHELDKLVGLSSISLAIWNTTNTVLQFFMKKEWHGDSRLQLSSKHQARLSQAIKLFFSGSHEEARKQLRKEAKTLFLMGHETGTHDINQYLCNEMFYCWVRLLSIEKQTSLIEAII